MDMNAHEALLAYLKHLEHHPCHTTYISGMYSQRLGATHTLSLNPQCYCSHRLVFHYSLDEFTISSKAHKSACPQPSAINLPTWPASCLYSQSTLRARDIGQPSLLGTRSLRNALRAMQLSARAPQLRLQAVRNGEKEPHPSNSG
eukprot:scaffold7876_cov417-Prasinococcus_capsulatus_cf.AAC.4